MFNLALSCSLFASPPIPVAAAQASQEGPAADATVVEAPKELSALEAGAPTGEPTGGSTHVEPRAAPSTFRRYFSRPLAPSARFLDHGVLQVAFSAGFPHQYRWQVQLGLFDYLSGGVTAHWLDGQTRPQFAAQGALALLRRRSIELGLSYHQVLHAPAEIEDAGFRLRSHYMVGTLAFSTGPFSAGVDAGAVRFRGASIDPMAEPGTYRWRTLPGGGVFARFGTRRWGVGVQGHMPIWSLEFMLDLRFGLFEMRERGGWRLRSTRVVSTSSSP